MGREWTGPLEKLDDYRYTIPRSYKDEMRAPGVIYADARLIQDVVKDFALEQVANVATMPGIQKASMAMPDIHWGYGFPIGGVAAFDAEEGVLSPGGVGYDINCGVRLIRTDLQREDVQAKLKPLVDAIFANVPSGVGSKGKIRLGRKELKDVLDRGAPWAVERDYGWDQDLERIEEGGSFELAESDRVSEKALSRGMPQLGSLGAGNHFVEIQFVEEVRNPDAAKAMGIDREGQVCVMIHTGSRGCGHQIATDYIRLHEQAVRKYGIFLPDRQLASAPVNSKEGQDYFHAMYAGANYAFGNRQLITHWTRESFEAVLDTPADDLGLEIVYDVSHNMAKLEEHNVEGTRKEVYVHRKGATRAFPPGHPDIPLRYRDIGQPVLIPGSMGTHSFVLVGTEGAMEQTFGSTCHGAGRIMSRKAAARRWRADEVREDLERQGIYAHSASWKGLVEEAPGAYKDVENVVGVCQGAGISDIVVKLRPLGVVKG
ncbi:MAG: RtcB family protein [Thermoplasmata archaeon]|jgi:tRNA-splicing ligase RtcB